MTVFLFPIYLYNQLTCEEVTTVIPISFASPYRCSSTSTLVALPTLFFLGYEKQVTISLKRKRKRKIIHTWCTRQEYQIWAYERTSVPYRTE